MEQPDWSAPGETEAESVAGAMVAPFLVRDMFDALPAWVVALEGPEHLLAVASDVARDSMTWPGGRRTSAGDVFHPVGEHDLLAVLDEVYRTGVPFTARDWPIGVGPAVEGGEVFGDLTVSPWNASEGSARGVLMLHVDVSARVHQSKVDARAVTNAESRYRDAREVVESLQQALLPGALPVLPGLRVAARYLVGASATAAGGDWFDAIVLPDERVVLVVGDIVGHGLRASAAMGRLRAIVNHVLRREHDLVSAIVEIDSVAAQDAEFRAATLIVVTVDPTTGQCRYVTCGHPPALVVSPGGRTRFLPVTGSGPLGVGTDVVERVGQIAPGDTVLLYSDGLIERPGQTINAGLEALVAVAANATSDTTSLESGATLAERICRLSVELLSDGHVDDVTTLTFQRVAGAPKVLSAEFSDTEKGVEARREVRRWLEALDADPDAVWRLELAAGELISNAVQHARPNNEHPARVAARLRTDGVVEITVSDGGTWRQVERTPTIGGRGLHIAGQLVDNLVFDQATAQRAGSRVTIEHQLVRPAVLGTAAAAPVTAPAPPFAISVRSLDDGTTTLRVSGPLDTTTINEFNRSCIASSRGGLLDVTLDLSDVTLLSSVAVKALFDFADQLGRHGHDLDIVAPATSPAAVILELVSLPADT